MDARLFPSVYSGQRIHLGVTGSIAAYRSLDLVRHLARLSVPVSATLTKGGSEFITPLSLKALGAEPVFTDMFTADQAAFAHLYPQHEAQALLVAPASASTLARMAHGLADDLLSCQALAFPGPIIVAPAMNPHMWNAPATRANVATLTERGVIFAGPVSGDVACGDTGQGRLIELEEIIALVLKAITEQDMAGRKVLITLGPTREAFDAVRFWSNPSSGRMGAALAVAAWLRGAEVTAVCGPCAVQLPEGIERIDVTTAVDMHQVCLDLWPGMDIGCLVAAVADFRPRPHGQGKLKKDSIGPDGLTISFDPNPDVLRDLGVDKADHQQLVGFAAEAVPDASQLADLAKGKLKAKNLDLLAANRIDQPGSGFASLDNTVLVVDGQGRVEQWPCLPKPEVAWRLWDQLISL